MTRYSLMTEPPAGKSARFASLAPTAPPRANPTSSSAASCPRVRLARTRHSLGKRSAKDFWEQPRLTQQKRRTPTRRRTSGACVPSSSCRLTNKGACWRHLQAETSRRTPHEPPARRAPTVVPALLAPVAHRWLPATILHWPGLPAGGRERRRKQLPVSGSPLCRR